MSNSESTLQITTVAMIRKFYPGLLLNLSLNGVTLLGSPQQKAQIIQQARREGLTVGIPDILVYLPNGKVLNWEFKRPKGGTHTQSQRDIQKHLNTLGHHYEIIRSTEEAFASIASNTTRDFRVQQYQEVCPNTSEKQITERFQHWPIGTSLTVVLEDLQKVYYLQNTHT